MHVTELFSLSGRVALITGGAGLYGRQLVAGLAEAGARVFMASRQLAPLQEIANAHQQLGHQVEALAFDQGDESSILALRDNVLEKAGCCDILVNNAVLRPMKNAYADAVESFDLSMHVNATGLFCITRAFGDAMAERGRGAIVNIGSIHGMIAPDPWIYEGTGMSGWYPDYFFHKGGLINFTRFIASYYGSRGVRCNCVSPGGYQTEAHDPRFLENYSRHTMLHRLAGDDDLKGAVVFLASDAASYITGANLPVDGGYTAR